MNLICSLSCIGQSPALPPCQRSGLEKGPWAVLPNFAPPALTIQDSLAPEALVLGTVLLGPSASLHRPALGARANTAADDAMSSLRLFTLPGFHTCVDPGSTYMLVSDQLCPPHSPAVGPGFKKLQDRTIGALTPRTFTC